jgi:hypothetical protein
MDDAIALLNKYRDFLVNEHGFVACDVWPMEGLLLLTTDRARMDVAIKEMARLTGESTELCDVLEPYGLTVAEGLVVLMLLPEKEDHTTIYHEALHATIHYYDTIGANLDLRENDEILAYGQGYIVKLILENLYNKKKGK